jgi:hypothetical protein
LCSVLLRLCLLGAVSNYSEPFEAALEHTSEPIKVERDHAAVQGDAENGILVDLLREEPPDLVATVDEQVREDAKNHPEVENNTEEEESHRHCQAIDNVDDRAPKLMIG